MSNTKVVVCSVCLIAIVVGGIAGCATDKTIVHAVAKQDIETRVYEVFGMDCPGCHGGLVKLVKKIPGVESAQANWKTKRLKVYLHKNASVRDDAVFDAIRRSNFTPGKRPKQKQNEILDR